MLEKNSVLDTRCGWIVLPQGLMDHLSKEILRICLHWVRDCLWDLETCDSVCLDVEIILNSGSQRILKKEKEILMVS